MRRWPSWDRPIRRTGRCSPRLRRDHVHAVAALAAARIAMLERAPHRGAPAAARRRERPRHRRRPRRPRRPHPSRRRWPPARRSRSPPPPTRCRGTRRAGLPVGQGICATDPRVIPLGTRFDVPGYGPCVAADTGSAVIGATIDIWMPDAQASRVRDARPLPSRSDDAATALHPARARACLALVIPASGAAARDDGAGRGARPRHREGARRARFLGPRARASPSPTSRPASVIYRRNGWRPLLPASTEKLFTTRRARSARCGPTSASTTTVVGAGARAGPTWNGDLYLVGSGDPTFSSDDIDALAAQVRARGIRRVSGRIRGDETVFDAARSGPVARSLHRHRVAAALGARARSRRDAERPRRRQPVPQRGARAAAGAQRRPGVQVGVHFVAGGRAPAGALVLGRVQSDPLWRIVRFMDRHSDNFTAEMVAKAIGAYAGGRGTTARGMHVAGEVAAPHARRRRSARAPRRRLGPLARQSHDRRARSPGCSPALRPIRASPSRSRARSASPGVNGTLAHRLPALRGRVLAKSGTLDNVSALAGYVDGAAAGAASRSRCS